jgi:hypothetical protein
MLEGIDFDLYIEGELERLRKNYNQAEEQSSLRYYRFEKLQQEKE